MTARRNLLAGLSALSAAPAAAPLASPRGDAALVALGAEAARLEAAWSDAVRRDDDAAADAASAAQANVLALMAATTATSWTGVAAKASRLCFSLSAHNGRSLLYAEYPLVDSLAQDLQSLAGGTA